MTGCRYRRHRHGRYYLPISRLSLSLFVLSDFWDRRHALLFRTLRATLKEVLENRALQFPACVSPFGLCVCDCLPWDLHPRAHALHEQVLNYITPYKSSVGPSVFVQLLEKNMNVQKAGCSTKINFVIRCMCTMCLIRGNWKTYRRVTPLLVAISLGLIPH